MEGVGQWAALRFAHWFTRKDESEQVALDFVRDNRKYWSQEIGLAVFLVLDAVVPSWQAQVFAPDYVSPLDLLRRSMPRRP